ncbi:DoxX family protein [Nocardia sp. alder85J]|uniref:DoxX family protein n=1 Tax=Nocardia sp. alder85J TaxID=2862949 RepID=UPI001CD61DEE|nr:DoxX family protein [Nocardia sp. alder85J]MCX4097671.1 DoxX family protein [Nocardia sp. alder85J]
MSATASPVSPAHAAADPLPGSLGADIGLLVLRVVVGVVMAAHGTQKLFGWFHGNGLSATGRFFEAKGYPAGKTMAVIAGLSETFGGLGLIVGLLTPLAAAAVMGVMINAVAVKSGFFAPKGYEYELVLLAAVVTLALIGPGRLALDRAVPALRHYRLVYGVAAIVLAAVVAGVVLSMRD